VVIFIPAETVVVVGLLARWRIAIPRNVLDCLTRP
jgi:hypothetical protein